MNITDVDDKIIRNAAAAGNAHRRVHGKICEGVFRGPGIVARGAAGALPRATEHIPEMVELIQKLAAKGAAYRVEDGSWYFRLAAYPEYGKLRRKI